MRSDSLLAATLAIATVASAEVERPRFYFPRHIKRVTSNGSPALPVSPNRPRDGLGNFLDDFTLPKLSLLPTLTGTGTIPPIIVLPTPSKKSSSTKSSSSSSSSHSKAITFGPGGVVTTTEKPKAEATPTSSSSDDFLDFLGGLLGPGTAKTTTAPSTTETVSTTKSASTSSTPGGLLNLPPLTIPPILPTPTTTSSDASNTTTSSSGFDWNLSSLLPFPPVTTDTTGLGSILSSIISTAGPTNGSATITSSSTNSTGPVTSLPSNGTITTSFPYPTTTGSSGPAKNGTVSMTKPTSLPTLTATAPTETSVPATTTAPTTPPPQSIVATGTNTDSTWLPSSVLVATSATNAGSSPSSAVTGIPSTIPKVISPPTGPSSGAPAGSKLVQIGFLFPLNYQFVVTNPVSSAQIFQWLPSAMAGGLELKVEQVVMKSLLPLDTTQRLGYITTLAMVYIPTNMYNKLVLGIHTPTSLLNNRPSPGENTLVSLIDRSIPLTPGSNLPGTDTTGNESQKPTEAPDTGVFSSAGQQKQSSSAMKSTAGIATGVVGAAAAYGAAMFFIARRYKKRRQSHRRSSSTFGGPEMFMAGSPSLMGATQPIMSGGRTSPGEAGNDRNSRGSGSSGSNSARTQQISGPMMAENSLGWN